MQKSQQFPPQKAQPDSSKRIRDKEVQSWRFRKFRLRLLKNRKAYALQHDLALCVACAAAGLPYHVQTVELHHKRPRALYPELTYDPANCVFLCKPHHSIETAKEEATGIKRGPRTVISGRPGIGKTTLAKSIPGAVVWDMDVRARDLGYDDQFPRPANQLNILKMDRDRFIERMKTSDPKHLVLIATYPKTARWIGEHIGAEVIHLR